MKDRALYIHVPFCKSKCLYCDFPSFSGKESLMKDYIECLTKELSTINDSYISSIYIGGGTPTYLPLEMLGLIGDALKGLNKAPDLEFTVECNPGTLNFEKASMLKSIGVNRLSIGLQAFQNSLLKKIGRIHDKDDFLNSINIAKNVGFNNINVDIMFGLPDQTLDDLSITIDNLISLNIEHISAYSLIIEEGTVFYNMYENGKLKLPEEDLEREMYHLILKKMSNNNYQQYEISNFSKPFRECKHNNVYWSMGEYIGCGVAAHSFINGTRISNTPSVEEYIYNMKNHKSTVCSKHINTLEDNMEEYVFLGLRKTKGISIIKFKELYGIDFFSVYKDVLNKHLNNGLLFLCKDNIYLTQEGIELSNMVMSDFILT